jgi:hypothetical protein
MRFINTYLNEIFARLTCVALIQPEKGSRFVGYSKWPSTNQIAMIESGTPNNHAIA